MIPIAIPWSCLQEGAVHPRCFQCSQNSLCVPSATLRDQQSGPKQEMDKYLHCWREWLCLDIFHLLRSLFSTFFPCRFVFHVLNTFQFLPHKLLLCLLSPSMHYKHQHRSNLTKTGPLDFGVNSLGSLKKKKYIDIKNVETFFKAGRRKCWGCPALW